MFNQIFKKNNDIQIGIIGKGKMGKEIFNHFLDYNYKIILICRNKDDVPTEKEKIEKNLRKKLRRGYIDEETYEKKMQSILVSNNIENLKQCNIVIESVYEDLSLKNKMFKDIENVVDEDCILATNTSSIPLKDIFLKCRKKDRCLGIHFFFPVKMIRSVEINKTKETGEKYVSFVKDVLEDASCEPLELEEKYNVALNKILSVLMAKVIRIYKDKYLSMKEIDDILTSKLFKYGLFETINSIGMDTVIRSFKNFNASSDERYKDMYSDVILDLNRMLEELASLENSRDIFEYEKIHPLENTKLDEAEVKKYEQKIIKNMMNCLLNEVNYFRVNVKDKNVKSSIIEVLGLQDYAVEALN